MKHIFKKNLLAILQDVSHILNHLAHSGQKDYIETALIYLFDSRQTDNVQVVLDYVKNIFKPVMGEEIMGTVADYLRQQGKEEGLKQGLEQGLHQGLEQGLHQGLEQGLHQGKLADARKMLLRHMEPAVIADITELNIKEILAEAEKLKETAH